MTQKKKHKYKKNNKTKIKKYSVIVPTMWRWADRFTSFIKQLCDCKYVDEILIYETEYDLLQLLMTQKIDIKIRELGILM